ncbi:hypothetical protein GCM10009715_33130 [Paeniglutamicibacter psychrophenolicus]
MNKLQLLDESGPLQSVPMHRAAVVARRSLELCCQPFPGLNRMRIQGVDNNFGDPGPDAFQP